MFKKLLLVMSLLFTFSCEDNVAVDVDEETSMKLWLGGVEVDVEATYEKITTYGEEVEYLAENGHTYTKKIFVIHFQEEGGRVELDKEHYAIVFTDWEGRTSNSKPVDVGNYKWPAECPICVRICICDHGAPSKWVRMEIFGEEDVAVSGRSEEHTSELQSRRNLVCRLLLEKKKSLTSTHDDTSSTLTLQIQ